ncbi:MAG: MMPL family transporter [Actinomycetota bacterium]
MLQRLGGFTVRHKLWVVAGTVVFIVVAGALGGGVLNKLSSGGFADPDAEATRAATIIQEQFHAGTPNLILLVTANEGTVDDPAAARAGLALTQELAAEPKVEQVYSYWSLGNAPPLRSQDGSQALVMARIPGSEEDVMHGAEELSEPYTRSDAAIDVVPTGQAEIYRQISTQVEQDLRKAELVTFPIVLLLLFLVFAGLVAAGLPLAVAVVAVLGTLMVLSGITELTEVSIFSLNLTTAMGIGLGIDYSLFIVSRFREELRGGLDTQDAVVRTVTTAGRTVLFSGLTVAISLAALLVFPMYFLRSFAYAGITVVVMAVLGAIVFLPALLAVLGPKVNSLSIRRKDAEDVPGFWHSLAMFVMRWPLPIATVVVIFLAVLGAPFFNVQFGLPDDRVLPADVSSRAAQDQIRQNFTSFEAGALSLVAPDASLGDSGDQALADYATRLSAISGVARVDAATGSYSDGTLVMPPSPESQRFVTDEATWLAVVPSGEPLSAEGERLVDDVRSLDSPFNVLVAGPSAELVDAKASIFARVPWAAALILTATFVVLFMMTGSLLVPVKAVVLNLLSLSATFGAMVWIFQEGHLSELLGFTPTGTLDTSTPILMFCVAFGLSMDYEVFVLSRIKEEYDRTGDNAASVAWGLEKTGKIVTAAAALLAAVFIAFATSGISILKLLGVGLALAVIMDASLVRATLVPAFMRLAGKANWWAPGPLRRFHERFGFSEAGGEMSAPASRPVPAAEGSPAAPGQPGAPAEPPKPAPGGLEASTTWSPFRR